MTVKAIGETVIGGATVTTVLIGQKEHNFALIFHSNPK